MQVQLVADRLVQQHGHDRGVDAAGEAADHPALADLGADLGDGAVVEGGHRPVALAAAILSANLRSSLAPSGVCTTSGWNCTP